MLCLLQDKEGTDMAEQVDWSLDRCTTSTHMLTQQLSKQCRLMSLSGKAPSQAGIG